MSSLWSLSRASSTKPPPPLPSRPTGLGRINRGPSIQSTSVPLLAQQARSPSLRSQNSTWPAREQRICVVVIGSVGFARRTVGVVRQADAAKRPPERLEDEGHVRRIDRARELVAGRGIDCRRTTVAHLAQASGDLGLRIAKQWKAIPPPRTVSQECTHLGGRASLRGSVRAAPSLPQRAAAPRRRPRARGPSRGASGTSRATRSATAPAPAPTAAKFDGASRRRSARTRAAIVRCRPARRPRSSTRAPAWC
mmetsp:Transcript_7246/g.30069  ORF Transcript_7246/g.30069 Transcript_7246/m.30069 type:complete len:252 (-) Transcript_7246:25-780(-)